MRHAIIAMVVAAITPSRAFADGSPAWTTRAEQIVARIKVPARSNVPPQDGTGFLVGFDAQSIYLVTAGHVIWPKDSTHDGDVRLEARLKDCDAALPAVASVAKVSAIDDLDLALLTIRIADISGDVQKRCQSVLKHLDRLPRHIVDPEGDSLSENAPAWFIGPAQGFEGREARPIIFKKHVRNTLAFDRWGFTPGDSGSPVFSEGGRVIGMVVTSTGLATRFSLILTTLERDWEVPTNLVGQYTKLSFDEYSRARISIDNAPDVQLERAHPAPQGSVAVKLWTDNTHVVADIVHVAGTDMSCDVTTSKWLARHRRAASYTTVALVAAAGVAFALAGMAEDSYKQSPSRSNYDNVGMFNAMAIGTGSVALVSLGGTVFGFLASDRTGITCRQSAQ